MTETQQRQILAAEISKYIHRGWAVESMTDKTAVIVKKVTGSGVGGNIALTILTCGLWLLLWVPALMAQSMLGTTNQFRLVLTVGDDGTITRR